MKANELSGKDLMIGDWVCFDGDVEHTNPVQIDVVCQEEAGVDGDYDDKWLPIPLTAGILEKNLSTTPQIQYWDDFLSKSFGEDFYEIWYHGDVAELVISIRYVHELQHVLKLCGIEKEIEL